MSSQGPEVGSGWGASFSTSAFLLSLPLPTKPGFSLSRHKTSVALTIIDDKLSMKRTTRYNQLCACNSVPALSRWISCGRHMVLPCLTLHMVSDHEGANNPLGVGLSSEYKDIRPSVPTQSSFGTLQTRQSLTVGLRATHAQVSSEGTAPV